MTYGKTKNNSMTTKSNGLNSLDLEWLAFQYFTDELTEDARIQFENSLEKDQLAREALARAVELTQAVAMVEVPSHEAASNDTVCLPSEMDATQILPPNRASSAWMAPTAWLAVVGLVCVAALLYWNPLGPPANLHPGSQPVTENGASASDSGELASLWVETGEFLVTTPLVSEDEPVDGLLDNGLLDDRQLESQGEPGMRSEVDVDRLQAPSWMMAAFTVFTDVEMQESRHEN